jgi:tetratricopeptide (TPR) repeat protein
MSSAVANANESFSIPARKGLLFPQGMRTLLYSLLLTIATAAVYYPAHKAKFINLDDGQYVVENGHVTTGLTWSNVRWSLSTFYASNWHPLTWVSHATDVELFHLNPAGHHDTNMFLHVVNVLLLFLVLQQATGYSGRSFVVAALFALHPMNVESVAWVAERKTMLSMLFFLLALGMYRWYACKPRVGRYLAFAALFVLGLMAKPQVITFPFVLLLWDYWPLRRMFASAAEPTSSTETQALIPARSLSQLIREKVPLFLLIVVDSLVTMKAQLVGRPSTWSYTFWIRTGNAIVAYARYLEKTFWPTHLALLYPHPGNSLRGWEVLASALLLVAITALVALNWRRRYLVVGWLWFLGTMVPMVGIVQFGRQAMADRYAYLPFIGLFIMICWGVAEWARRRHLPTAVLAGCTIVILLALAAVTHRQLGYWLDDAKLWAHTLAVTSPSNWYAEALLGDALLKQGYRSEALPHFHNAMAVNPNEPTSNLQVALYEHEHGNLADAIGHYKKALGAMEANDKNKYQVLINMGYVYQKLGDPEHSRECFEAAAKLKSQQQN